MIPFILELILIVRGVEHSARLVFRYSRDEFVLARLGGDRDPVIASMAP